MDKRLMDRQVTEEVSQERIWFTSALRPIKTTVLELHEAYRLLIEVVKVFSKITTPEIPEKLNKSYTKLFDLVESNKDLVVEKLADQYEHENPSDDLPSFYFNPHVFEDKYYRPFRNLHTARKELEDYGLTWEDVLNKMYHCLGSIEDLITELVEEEKDTVHKNDLFKKVEAILKAYEEVDINSYFTFEDMTFKLKTIDGNIAVIDFHPKEGYKTTDPFCLMKALVEYLITHGKRDGNFLRADVPRSHILDYIGKHFTVDVNREKWLGSTKNNLKNKIPIAYRELIEIGDFNKKTNTYQFSLKLPI